MVVQVVSSIWCCAMLCMGGSGRVVFVWFVSRPGCDDVCSSGGYAV